MALNVWPTTAPKRVPDQPFQGVQPSKTSVLASFPMLAAVSSTGLIAITSNDGSISLVGDKQPTLTWPTPKTAASAIMFRSNTDLVAVREGVLYTWDLSPK